jgi:hypothetical protein
MYRQTDRANSRQSNLAAVCVSRELEKRSSFCSPFRELRLVPKGNRWHSHVNLIHRRLRLRITE